MRLGFAVGAMSATGLARASTYYWDPFGAGSPGGSGVWDDISPDWSPNVSGGSNVVWPNGRPSGDEAFFGGSGGTVSLDPIAGSVFVNSLAFGAAYTINGPASGITTLNLSGTNPAISIGSLSITIGADLTGTAGFKEVGTGNLMLAGNNSGLSGTITIQSTLSLSSSLSGSANATWNTGSGVLSYLPTQGGIGQTLQLGALTGSGHLTNSGATGASDVITYAVGALGTNTTFGGTISDSTSGDRTALSKVGNPTAGLIGNNGNETLTLTGNNTYTGPTTINGGTLFVVGAIAGSSSILLAPGGTAINPLWSTLELNPTSGSANQIGDTTAITLQGSTFQYNSSTSANPNEVLGSINLSSGLNFLIVSYLGSGTATVTAAALNRPAGGGTAWVSGQNLGLNTTATTGVGRFLLASAPPLVGGGAITTTDTPTERDAPIVSFLLGESSTTSGGGGTSTGFPNTFLTYSPNGGLRPLNPVDEFVATPTAGQNTRIEANVTVSSNVSVNSLIVDSGAITVGAGATLDVASGAVLLNATSGAAISATDSSSMLSFNNGEAIISAIGINPKAGTLPVTVTPNLTNLTRLTVQGTSGTSGGRLILTQGSNTSDVAPVYLLGATLSVAQDYNLGYASGNNAITFPVGSAGALQLTGTQFTTSKGISLLGNGIIDATGSASIAGLVSGPGGFQSIGNGTLALSNLLNTYAGMTAVGLGTLALVANSNNNIPNSLIILAGDTPGSGATLSAVGLTAAGGFQLRAGQTLAGFGSVAAPTAGLIVSSGATISGGDAVSRTGNLTTSGRQTWNSGGEYLWKIDLTNPGNPATLNNDKSGAHWDQLTMSALTVAATGNSPFDLQILGLTGTGTGAFDPTKNYSWVAANLPTGSASGNLAGAFSLNVSGFSNYKVPGSFSAAFDSADDPGFTDLVISYTAVPEPTAFALFAPLSAGLLLRRRRRAAMN